MSVARHVVGMVTRHAVPDHLGDPPGRQPAGSAAQGGSLLELQGLTVHYGLIQALRNVSLRLEQGKLVAVLGPNGAGKSSLARAVSGLVAPKEGSIWYAGEDVTRLSVERRVERGLSLVPEGRGQLRNLTVRENLILGSYRSGKRSTRAPSMEGVLTMFSQIEGLLGRKAGVLSGGELQMLAIARALMGEPRLLVLDEPTMGLAPRIVLDVRRILTELRDRGVGVLLLEQNAVIGLAVADYVYVLEHGEVAWEGEASAAASRSELVAAYLGDAG